MCKKDMKCKYMFMLPLEKWRKGLIAIQIRAIGNLDMLFYCHQVVELKDVWPQKCNSVGWRVLSMIRSDLDWQLYNFLTKYDIACITMARKYVTCISKYGIRMDHNEITYWWAQYHFRYSLLSRVPSRFHFILSFCLRCLYLIKKHLPVILYNN